MQVAPRVSSLLMIAKYIPKQYTQCMIRVKTNRINTLRTQSGETCKFDTIIYLGFR